MSSNQGWIRLDRAIFNWEWYTEQNVKSVFLHALLRANHSPIQWRGISIARGQFFTSLDSLAYETGLSKQKIRTALKKLESTGELTSKQQAGGRMITVIKYERYQDINSQPNSQPTGNQQAANRRATPNNNDNKENNENNENNITPTITPAASGGELLDEVDTPPKKQAKKKSKKAFTPPSREEFIDHAVATLPRRNPDWSAEQAFRCADQQFDNYVDQDWHDGNGKKIANWKNKSITAMLYRKPHNFGINPQFFLEQKKIAANSASPL